MTNQSDNVSVIPRVPNIVALLVFLLIQGVVYFDAIQVLVRRWLNEDEYGHGPLLVLLAVYFFWQNLDKINALHADRRYLGLLLIIASSALFLAGEISALLLLIHYALIGTICGILICLYGFRVVRVVYPSIILLLFAIPLPYFLQTELTISLQLISSYIGVAIIKALSIPAYLEGNVIDLGVMKLQVVEACAGLRYMFSLLSFGFICAYIYQAELWKRLFILLSAIPITILMNSTRIAVVGILVHHSGIQAAEGFSHQFQGMAIFLVCIVVLLLEMWLLTKIGTSRKSLLSTIAIETVEQPAANHSQALNIRLYLLSIMVIIGFFIVQTALVNRTETIPQRKNFVHFPLVIGQWTGHAIPIQKINLEALKLSDYLSVDYREPETGIPVNVYIAYYESQRKEASPHSPRVCIPGDGWEIADISRRQLLLTQTNTTVAYNRAIIKKGSSTQLVYYWFQQRGRFIANEYLMKWYLFYDAVTINRSDGALVRLVTPVLPNESIEKSDQRLVLLLNKTVPYTADYIPE